MTTNKKQAKQDTIAQAHAQADAMLAMHKTNKKEHHANYHRYVIGFTLLMIVVIGFLFLASFN